MRCRRAIGFCVRVVNRARVCVARISRISIAASILACGACSQNREFRVMETSVVPLPIQLSYRAPASTETVLGGPTRRPEITPLPNFCSDADDRNAWLTASDIAQPLVLCDAHSDVVSQPTEPFDVPQYQESFGQHFREDIHELWPEIRQDHANYYSLENFSRLACGFAVGAVLANTDADQKIRDWYQRDVRSKESGRLGLVAKGFGNGAYVIPAMTAGWLVGEVEYDTVWGQTIGEWGERSIRSAIVGTPPMLLMQYVTGGSRPSDPNPHSAWRPFGDNNGVSGHSYICALPFINAAKMTDEWPLKVGLYACSTICGWSRIDCDAHYTSQAILGWWMAYCAAAAVDETGPRDSHWDISPWPMTNGGGMAVTYQY